MLPQGERDLVCLAGLRKPETKMRDSRCRGGPGLEGGGYEALMLSVVRLLLWATRNAGLDTQGSRIAPALRREGETR